MPLGGNLKKINQNTLNPTSFVASEVNIPDNIEIMHGVYISEGVQLAQGCRIGPNVVFEQGGGIIVERDVYIGANATIMPGITLASRCVVRAGSVVLRSVPPRAIVEGNPANIVGYVDTKINLAKKSKNNRKTNSNSINTIGVDGVILQDMPVVPDLRGYLTVGEFEKHIPFVPKRYFIVYGVPTREVRGEHAHLSCHQFLICINGNCTVIADDGFNRVEVCLDSPHRGLYLPPLTWGIQYKYSADAILLVFASHHYDPSDYLRDYDEFLKYINNGDKNE
jgi:UDP-2-acetamido-3-amino-2,3-dideoxy-glucuronate N-acetyltransferase